MQKVIILAMAMLCWSASGRATDTHYLQKRVFLTHNKHTLIAIDIPTRRQIKFKLRIHEDIQAIRETKVTIAVLTNQRAIGFSFRRGWIPVNLELREQPLQLKAEDFAIFLETDRRLLSFDGATGAWSTRRKSVR